MSEIRNDSITIRVTKHEFIWVESAASNEDLSISSFVRRIVNKELKANFSDLEPKNNEKQTNNEPIPAWLGELLEQKKLNKT